MGLTDPIKVKYLIIFHLNSQMFFFTPIRFRFSLWPKCQLVWVLNEFWIHSKKWPKTKNTFDVWEQSDSHAMVNAAWSSYVNPTTGIPGGYRVNAGGNKSSGSVKKRWTQCNWHSCDSLSGFCTIQPRLSPSSLESMAEKTQEDRRLRPPLVPYRVWMELFIDANYNDGSNIIDEGDSAR